MIHELKCWPEYFDAIARGEKAFEVRYDGDRGFSVGDELKLLRWQPDKSGGYQTDTDGEKYWLHDTNPAELRATVTYKMPGGRFGIAEHWCVLGIALHKEDDDAN